jgi:hypothetical protein
MPRLPKGERSEIHWYPANFPEADFWPGIASGHRIIPSLKSLRGWSCGSRTSRIYLCSKRNTTRCWPIHAVSRTLKDFFLFELDMEAMAQQVAPALYQQRVSDPAVIK